jgi:hypothetical protein
MDILNLGETPEEFVEQEDGSVLILDEEPEQLESTFDENLAETISAKALKEMAAEFCELVEKDKESRKRRDEQYEEGLRRTGLGDDAPGGAEFEGASKVVHPVLAEACVDFSSRAIKELFPAQGPVKSYLAGENSPEKTERTLRKVKFMNWQLTTQMQEYRAELEQLLTQLPMGGSQYQKFWYDERLRRPAVEFVPVDEMLLPYATTNFYTSSRITHRQLITKYEFKRRVNSGLYRDIFDPAITPLPESTLAGSANDRIEGREEDGYNDDGLRAILEIYTDYEFEEDELVDDDNPAPYIITIDEDTEEVLAVYRNWDETNESRLKLDWFVEWKFIPWRGAYGIGLPHLIGGLAAALTGSLRALLDSAHINNAPTMLKLRSGRVVGQNTQVNVTQVCDIEGPANIDDIRKLAMPMPFNPPSPVLAGLMDKLYALAKGVVSTADDQLAATVGDRTPVGTTMALIEQGSVIYSAVHARLHESQKRALQILQRLDLVYLPEQDLSALGEITVTSEDFANTLDVIPVSDPSIFSESQRFAQVQALIQMSADQAVPWNKVELYRRAMRQMRIEAIDDILKAPPEPLTADPATENAGTTQEGRPLKASQEQDHMAHIQSHLAAIAAPWVMANPQVPPNVVKGVLGHVNEHIQMLVSNAVAETVQQIISDYSMQMMPITPEQAVVIATQQATQQLGPQLQNIMQQMGQIDQVVSQRTPPPQMPPEVQASIQIAQMEIQRKTQADQASMQAEQAKYQASMQIEQAKLQNGQQADQAKLQMQQAEMQMRQQLDQQRMQFEQQIQQARLQFEQQLGFARHELNKMTAQTQAQATQSTLQTKSQIDLMKNEQNNHQKQVTELLKNRDDNKTNMEIAQQKLAADLQVEAAKLSMQELDKTAEITKGMAGVQDSLNKVLSDKLGGAVDEAMVIIETKEL